MADADINKGVQILLERMSSNPDEFVPDIRNGYPPKWRNIMMGVEMRSKDGREYKDQLPFLTDKEIKLLWDKMRSLQGDLFTKQVMDTLLTDSREYLMRDLPFDVDGLSSGDKAELSSLLRAVTSGRGKK